MTSWVALLRGINVSGKNIIKMKALRESFPTETFSNLKTHLQSGNIVWSSSETLDKSEWERTLSNHILDHFGIQVPVLCYTQEEWQLIHNSLPWPEIAMAQGNKVLIGCVSQPNLVESDTQYLRSYLQEEDLMEWHSPALFIHFAGGMGKSKMGIDKLEKWAHSPVTTRNWNTVKAIQKLLEEI